MINDHYFIENFRSNIQNDELNYCPHQSELFLMIQLFPSVIIFLIS